jgi:single-strand DNA-binding protein
LRKTFVKRDKIYIEGRIKSRQWQTEDGATKHTSEIQVTEFTFYRQRKMLKTTSKIAVGIRKTNFDPENDGLPINDLPF